ncbi:MAG: membrane protein insertion efficiency factor YidD [Ruminococcus sp.]|nr:membrane protein insertion efficiency factor YidD [Ruminococcus sp.]
MKLLSAIFTLPIRFYQRFISPLFPARCKYYPTCSCYAVDAYKKHGVIKGTVLTGWRLLRCNPWSLGGVDRVPERFELDYFKIKRRRG